MSQRTVWKQSMQRNKPLRDKSAWAWREETSAAIQSRWQHGYREGDERSKAVEEQEWCSERWVSSGWEMGVWTKLLLQMVWDMRAAEPKVTKAFGMRIRVEKQDGEVQLHVSKTGTFVHFSLQNYLQLSIMSSGNLGLSPATIWASFCNFDVWAVASGL